MGKLVYENIFNPNTINIFTDASIFKTPKGETIGCSGALVVYTPIARADHVVDSKYQILRQSTNNESEITAIWLGFLCALQYRKPNTTINLFSDSKICIYGLRVWIYNWMKNKNNDTLLSSSGMEVANQNIILRIINTICENELQINLFHQKGHVELFKEKSINNAIKVFNESNNFECDYNLMYNLSKYNDMIDNSTRNILFMEKEFEDYNKGINPIQFVPIFDLYKYSNLIKFKGV